MFPPHFVGGAVFCGFAMVLVLVIPLRRVYALESFITLRHLELMGLVLLATGWIIAYGYFTEFFTAWWSGDIFDQFTNANRAPGPYAPAFWVMLVCNVGVPQLMWSRRLRRSIPVLFAVALLVNLGMWLERYVIVITALHRDFLPSSWGMYFPTRWDWATFIGTGGLFLSLLFLFVRFLPAIAMSELRRQVAEPETSSHETALWSHGIVRSPPRGCGKRCRRRAPPECPAGETFTPYPVEGWRRKRRAAPVTVLRLRVRWASLRF